MADNEKKEGGGWGGWIAAIGVVIAAVLAYIGFNKGVIKIDGSDPQETKDFKKFRQLEIAAFHHENAQGKFPANVYQENQPNAADPKDEKSKKYKGLSWRVQILPYLDDPKAKELYSRFKLDESWDSPHNKPLIKEMPEVFAVGGDKAMAAEGKTFIQSFQGDAKRDDRGRPESGESYFISSVPGDKRSAADVRDGLSNTLMIVQAANAVEWTKPQDLSFEPDGTAPKLGGNPKRGALVGMADGEIGLLKQTIKPDVLKAMATINGNEMLWLEKNEGSPELSSRLITPSIPAPPRER